MAKKETAPDVEQGGRESSPVGLLERTLSVIELLASNARGLPLSEIADRLDIPRSAAHRVLTSLVERRYVRQERGQGAYLLTPKIAALGLKFLSDTGVTDLAQPILDRLARETGELVRLALVDGRHLTWVAKAQGSPFGLRYDPDMGREARLSCSANGHAWLSCLGDEEALALVGEQGFGTRDAYGPRAPQTPQDLLRSLRLARKRGYAITCQTFAAGLNAMAAPVRHPDRGDPFGVLSVAGPSIRLPETRMQALAPLLLHAAEELSLAGLASPPFGSAQPGLAPQPGRRSGAARARRKPGPKDDDARLP